MEILCVLYGSRNKQQIFPYTKLKMAFFMTELERVYCAVRTDSLYSTDTSCIRSRNKNKLRGLIPHANYTDRVAAAGRRS